VNPGAGLPDRLSERTDAARGETPVPGVCYLPDFAGTERASRWLEGLGRDICWQTEEIVLFGKSRTVPRLVAWAGDVGTCYRYSGCDHQGEGWSPLLAEIRDVVAAELNEVPNFVLLNRYRSGADSMGWHRDDEPMASDVLASLSLGAERRFLLRHPAADGSIPLVLEHGSLLLFDRNLPHSLPKTTRCLGERINLSFRRLP
jgi:alkylated DNA repair dioxygenase AlkB